MRWNRRAWLTLAMVSALISVCVGAFAAHGGAAPAASELLRTGAQYQFMHAMACVACAVFMGLGARGAAHAPALFLAGSALFSGSLYAVALGAPRWIGAVTPIGGLLFLTGWLMLIWSARRIDQLLPAERKD
ncbi:MAG TPA: DUF423 domain-containing protein [Caulobacteraceae bacterium]